MTTLNELAVMLDDATGPSRELDCAVENALGLARTNHGPWVPGEGHIYAERAEPLPLSSSIDAALALVERLLPGWEWSIWRVGETCGATVYNTPEDEIEPSISSHAPTAPVAVLKALVAALIAQENHDAQA